MPNQPARWLRAGLAAGLGVVVLGGCTHSSTQHNLQDAGATPAADPPGHLCSLIPADLLHSLAPDSTGRDSTDTSQSDSKTAKCVAGELDVELTRYGAEYNSSAAAEAHAMTSTLCSKDGPPAVLSFAAVALHEPGVGDEACVGWTALPDTCQTNPGPCYTAVGMYARRGGDMLTVREEIGYEPSQGTDPSRLFRTEVELVANDIFQRLDA